MRATFLLQNTKAIIANTRMDKYLTKPSILTVLTNTIELF
jgi:hypothetical protein